MWVYWASSHSLDFIIIFKFHLVFIPVCIIYTILCVCVCVCVCWALSHSINKRVQNLAVSKEPWDISEVIRDKHGINKNIPGLGPQKKYSSRWPQQLRRFVYPKWPLTDACSNEIPNSLLLITNSLLYTPYISWFFVLANRDFKTFSRVVKFAIEEESNHSFSEGKNSDPCTCTVYCTSSIAYTNHIHASGLIGGTYFRVLLNSRIAPDLWNSRK